MDRTNMHPLSDTLTDNYIVFVIELLEISCRSHLQSPALPALTISIEMFPDVNELRGGELRQVQVGRLLCVSCHLCCGFLGSFGRDTWR